MKYLRHTPALKFALVLIFACVGPLFASNVDYLVVTHDDVLTEFQTLATHRASHNGFDVMVKTVAEISTNYSGADLQQKIRACIADIHQNYTHTNTPDGRMFVLLGGDNTLVPDRNCRVAADGDVSTDMPTDLYYAALNGTWNADGDSTYGEVSDNVDLTHHVLLGRVPVRTASQAAAYVNKVIAFENHTLGLDSTFYRKYLAVADQQFAPDYNYEIFNDGLPEYTEYSPVSDAEARVRSRYKNEMRPYWEATGEFAVFADTVTSWDSGVPGSYTLNAANLSTRMNEGWFFMTWDSHGSYTSFTLESGSFGTSSASALTGLTPFIYTVNCFTSGFDKAEPSLGEAMLRNPNGGALGYIAASRFGKLAGSNAYQTIFNQMLFTEKKVYLGQAFTDHKEYYIGNASGDNEFRWLMYSIVLLGDPALSMQTPPAALPVQTQTARNIAKQVALNGQDDGFPNVNPDTIITSLPANGSISDPNGGAITLVPYTLAAKGNVVDYTPDVDYVGADSFQYKLNDGGSGPDSGDSNTATASIDVTQSVEIILDNTDPSCTKNGFVFTSSQSDDYGDAPTYDKWIDRWFRFNPTFASAGWHDVYFWVASGLTSDPNGLLHLHHANGTESINIDYTAGSGDWVFLGTYYFNAGSTHYLEMDCVNSSFNVYADAAKFVSATAPAGVSLNVSANGLAVDETGTGDSYFIALESEPASDVTIQISTNADLGASPTSLTFTPANWQTQQKVTIEAVDNGILDGNRSATITHNATSADPKYNGISITDVDVSIYDNETQVATPVFTPSEGVYTSAQTVTITSQTPETTIYYTTDGSTPSASSTLYQGSFSIDTSATIKAIAFKSGFPDSMVSTASYLIGILAYEGFDYTADSDLDTLNGGNGWNGAWYDFGTEQFRVLAGSLQHGYASGETGNKAGNVSANRRNWRLLSTAYNDDSGDQTLYLSFLSQFPDTNTAAYRALELNNAGNGDPTRALQIGYLAGDGVAGSFSVRLNQDSALKATVGAPTADVVQFVIRLELKAGDNNDVVTIWQNPSSISSPSTTIAGSYDIDFDRLQIASYNNSTDSYFDEIKLGNEWSSVTTASPWTSAESWRDTYFGQTENSGIAADSYDYDGDGLDNLLERAFSTHPTDAADAFIPTHAISDISGSEYLSITYRRIAGGSGTTGNGYTADGITYTVQYDQDLTPPWSSGDITVVNVDNDNPVPGIDTVTVRLNTSVTTQSKQFIRLQVISNP